MIMAPPRWLAGLPVSLALHVIIVAAAVAFLRAERAPTSLIIDLTAIVAGHDDGPGSGGGAPAAGRPARGDDPRAAAPPRPSQRVASAPSPTPSAAEPEPAPLRAVEPRAPEVRASDPPQAATRETIPVPPPVALAVAPSAPAPSEPAGPASGSGSLSAVSRSSSQGGADGPTSGVGGNAATGFVGGERGGGGAGDQLAALTPGTGGGMGAGLGSEYAGYLARVRQQVQEGLRYPPVARRRGVSGTVQLEIAIDPAGVIAAVSVIGSSSHEILDRAAVDAVRALPRQPFPADVRPRALTVRLPVVFELQ
jgi:TonB family protein